MLVDSCIAERVAALNAAGVRTTGCCCGHGKGPAVVILEGGEELTLEEAERRV